ncbi:MAG: chromosome segregation ATPase [Prochloraceae cyanobacterium]
MRSDSEKSKIVSGAKASNSSESNQQQLFSQSRQPQQFPTYAGKNNSQSSSSSSPSHKINQPSERVLAMIEKAFVRNKSWLAWQLGAAVLVLVSGSIGYTATSFLLKLPETTNCTQVYWPIASASTRLYCAQLKADQKTADGLLEAITLVEILPQDNPLRSEINRKVEQWASGILNLGEEQFQAGQIESAIATAKRIPNYVQAYGLVDQRIKRWQSIWSKAEKIHNETEQQLKDSQWDKAFRSAIKLTNINNRYWAKQKYEQTISNIRLAQQESGKLDLAHTKLNQGNLDDLLDAIQKADQITLNSYAYQEAQNIINDAKSKLLKEINRLINNNQWNTVVLVVNRLPASLNLQEKVRDWKDLAAAGSRANLGTVAGLEAAIDLAKRIERTRPLYYDAQQLIRRWKLEIQDVQHLSKARQLAAPGRISDLIAAIAEARLIPRFNPRYQEAQRRIKGWTSTIQTIEDRPILNRAYQLASRGTVFDLQQAISEASLIYSGRALYPEAQQQIKKWTNNIQRQQDQPTLNRAIALANKGDIVGAIETARRIRPGRALYAQAQAKIRVWQSTGQVRQNLKQAYRLASSGTADALSRAIKLARQVPASTSSLKRESYQAINLWSEQLLDVAKQASQSSLTEGIRIARMVPPGTSAYNPARLQIEIWKKKLQRN